VGILEDVPIQVGEFLMPCDFVVLDIAEDFSAPLILVRPFLATAGAELNVQMGIMSFTICGERMDFHFPPPTPPLTPGAHSISSAPTPSSLPLILGVAIADWGGRSHLLPPVLPHPPPSPTAAIGGPPWVTLMPNFCHGEVLAAPPFTTLSAAPPSISPTLSS